MKRLERRRGAWSALAPWIESVIFTGFFLGVGFYFNPTNPFFVHSAFPWVWFAPVLIALRYGWGCSILSIIIIYVAFFIRIPQPLLAFDNRLFLLGGLFLTLLCATYQIIWSRRIRHGEKITNYIQERIEKIALNYNVLQLSHEYLERSFISKPVTLRSALEQLHLQLKKQEKFSQQTADQFLQLLAYYCSLEVAGLYMMSPNGNLDSTPFAKIGGIRPLALNNSLLKAALEKKTTVYITEEHIQESADYLVVAPLQTSTGIVFGLLLVEEMPFLALNEETLKTLTFLLIYFADSIFATDIGAPILKKFPDCSADFAAELLKLKKLQEQLKAESSLVVIKFLPDPQRENIIFKLTKERRGLDSTWLLEKGVNKFLFILMPLISQEGVAGYHQRLKRILQDDFGMTLDEQTVKMDYRLFSAYRDPVLMIDDLLEKK